MKSSISDAVFAIAEGGVVCHACEGVWGFACDPFNTEAVQKILAIKQREPIKGLLVIGGDESVFEPELAQLTELQRAQVRNSWPGHTTWLLPNVQFSRWITGDHPTVGARVPAHEQALLFASQWGGPLVSTSANIESEPPCLTQIEVEHQFAQNVDIILSGEIGDLTGSSRIIDAQTGTVIR